MIRTILYFAYVALSMLVVTPLGALAVIFGHIGLRKPASIFMYRVAQGWAWLLVKFSGCPLTVKGRENIPRTGGVCFVSNHGSILDIVLLLAYAGRPFGFIAKKELLLIPILNMWISVLGGFFIDRKNVRKAVGTINKGIASIKSGGAMLIFPEGHRSRGQGLLPFHSGSFKLATQSEAIIVPVALSRTYDAFERQGRICTVPVSITFCKPVYTAQLPINDRKQALADNVYRIIQEALEQTELAGKSAPAVPFTGAVSESRISPEGAWCWFADPRALHYENGRGINHTYIGYIDVHGNIKAAQYNFLSGEMRETLVRSRFQPDDHNNPAFLVLPDERVMIFYSRHTDEPLIYYRVSKNPGDISALGPEKMITVADNTTYPSPFFLSSDPEHLYLCWRGINWHPTIARLTLPDSSDDVSIDWGPHQIVQSTGARPYAKYASNGIDTICFAYTTGHPDNEDPNYLYFNYITINGADADSMTLSDVKGSVLSRIKDGAHNVDKTAYPAARPCAVVCADAFRNWVWQTALDGAGKPVIALARISGDKTSHDYYLAKWTGGEWKKTFLASGGGHFHQTPNVEMCYSGGMALDESNPDVVYCSVPVNGVYEIVKYTLQPDGTVTEAAVTRDSAKNNVRPYIISRSAGSPLRLVWMRGDYYYWVVNEKHPRGFPTAIYGGNLQCLIDE